MQLKRREEDLVTLHRSPVSLGFIFMEAKLVGIHIQLALLYKVLMLIYPRCKSRYNILCLCPTPLPPPPPPLYQNIKLICPNILQTPHLVLGTFCLHLQQRFKHAGYMCHTQYREDSLMSRSLASSTSFDICSSQRQDISKFTNN